MAFPKRGTRVLTVRGRRFLWHASPKAVEYGGAYTIREEHGGPLLHLAPARGFPSPSEAAAAIVLALDSGWDQRTPGSASWVVTRDGSLVFRDHEYTGWLDAMSVSHDETAIELFLDEWHGWTEDDRTNAPGVFGLFGSRLVRRMGFQNNFVFEIEGNELAFYTESQGAWRCFVRRHRRHEVLFQIDGTQPVAGWERLHRFLLQCMIFETLRDAPARVWGCITSELCDELTSPLSRLEFKPWPCGLDQTAFYAADGALAYVERERGDDCAWLYLGGHNADAIRFVRDHDVEWEDWAGLE